MTDVDGLTDFQNRGFATLEIKCGHTIKFTPQIRTLERATLAMGQAKPSLLILATYPFPEWPEEEQEDIDASWAKVFSLYFASPELDHPETWRSDDFDFRLTVNDVLAAYSFSLGVPYQDKLSADVPLILSDPDSPFVALDGLAALSSK